MILNLTVKNGFIKSRLGGGVGNKPPREREVKRSDNNPQERKKIKRGKKIQKKKDKKSSIEVQSLRNLGFRKVQTFSMYGIKTAKTLIQVHYVWYDAYPQTRTKLLLFVSYILMPKRKKN